MAGQNADDQVYRRNVTLLYERVCITIPPSINTNNYTVGARSGGGGGPTHLGRYSLPLLELQIIIVVCFNLFFHIIFQRLGIPRLVTYISAGISIGVILNHLEAGSVDHHLLTLQSQQTLGTLSQFGYMFFLFIIGVKMDMKMIITTGTKALIIGVITLMAPLIGGLIFSMIHISNNAQISAMKQDIVNVAVTQSLTTFPVISYVLSELGIINSELGRLALSSGVISEFLSIFLLTISTTLVTQGSQMSAPGVNGNAVMNIFLLVIFLIAAVFVIRPAMFWVIRRTPEGRPVKDKYVMIIIVGVLFSSMMSHGFGQFALFAPYIIGLIMPDGPPLGSALIEKLNTFVSGMLLPFFITTCASRVIIFDAHDLWNPKVYGVVLVVMITFAVKLIACLMIMEWGFKMPWNDSLTLSLIMSSKGIVEMATYSFLRDSGNITERSFTIAVFAILVQACVIPMIVKRFYDPSRKYAGYQKRNIAHLRSNDELRVLVCIHRPDNISSVIRFLDLSCPSNQSPMAVFVLHLIELVGRTSPVFISHQYQKKTVSNKSYSENVITAFHQFENSKATDEASVQIFTAISPTKLMNEDIGTLSLNKLTSLIILPFHRKWGMDGSVESDNHTIRALNSSLLDRAPCSLGVLIDRGHLMKPNVFESTQRIAIIFIGGDDDREALALTKRMVRGPASNTKLSVIRFMDKNGDDSKQWDWVMDTEVLKELKMGQMQGANDRVEYMEEMVSDGTEMALRLRAMEVGKFDLVIVGRRDGLDCPQTSGLSQWCEFPELGVLGDMLGSPDMETRASVLVVQQQRMAVKS